MAAQVQPKDRRVTITKGPSLMDLMHAQFCFVPNAQILPVFYTPEGEYRFDIIGSKVLDWSGTNWIFYGYRNVANAEKPIDWNSRNVAEIHYRTDKRKGHIRLKY